MIKRLLSMTVTVIMLVMCTITSVSALEPVTPSKDNSNNDPSKIESDLYVNGSREAAGEIFYEPGKNTVNSKVKFFMDLGLIDHYYPDMALSRNALKKFMKIVYGYDGAFEKYFPETDSEKKPLTFDEALLVFMDMTGYSNIAELDGSSKDSYYRMALKYDLLDHVNVDEARKKLTAEQFVEMAYNAVNANMVYESNGQYTIRSGTTAVGEYLHMTETGGVVRANSYTTLNGDDGVGENRLRIEGVIYKVKMNENVDDYLGYSVTAYLDDDDNIVSISVDENRNTLKEFDNDSDIDDSPSKEQFVYYDESNKKKTLKIDKYADLIYNYVPCTEYTADFYPIKNGTLKLIDNNGDNVYDVVFKKEYTSFIPYSRSANDYTVTDILGNVYDLYELVNNGEYKGISASNGDELTFDYISTTTVISILTKWKSNVATEVIIPDKSTFEGTYKTYDSSDETYTIGDKEFKMAEIYSRYNNGKFPFELGANVLVYLDPLGRIVNAETTTLAYKYAWLVGMDVKGFGNVKIKAYTQDATMRIYDVAKKVKLNGSRIEAEKLLDNHSLYFGGSVVEQLIKYKVNSDGVIIGINTANSNNCGLGKTKNNNDDTIELNLNYWDKLNDAATESEKMDYRLWYNGGSSNILGGKYRINTDKTIIFGIPTKAARDENGDRAFQIATTLNDDERIAVNLYDVDDEFNVGAVTRQINSIKNDYINFGYGAVVVSEVRTAMDEKYEEPLTYVYGQGASGWASIKKQHPDFGVLLSFSPLLKYGFKNDAQKRTLYESVKTMSDLRPGMICHFNENGGYVVQFTPLFIYDDSRPQEEQYFEFMSLESWSDYKEIYDDDGNILPDHSTNYTKRDGVTKQTFYGKDVIAYGKVTKKCYDGFVFNAHIGEADEEEWSRRIFALPTKACTLFDTNRKKVENITVADIQAGDNVFIQSNNGNSPGIVVYR